MNLAKDQLLGSHHDVGCVARQSTDIKSSSSDVAGFSMFVWVLLVPPGSVQAGRTHICPQMFPGQCIWKRTGTTVNEESAHTETPRRISSVKEQMPV